MRFATVSCSISVIPLLLNYFYSQDPVLNISLFIFSEVTKVTTIIWCKRRESVTEIQQIQVDFLYKCLLNAFLYKSLILKVHTREMHG